MTEVTGQVSEYRVSLRLLHPIVAVQVPELGLLTHEATRTAYACRRY